MKILRITLFIIALTSCSFSFGQNSDTVHYKVLRNEPNSINNMYIYAMPLNIDFMIQYINISYGFGAEYNYKDKFILGVDYKRSYTEKLNNLIHGTDDLSLQKTGSAIGGEKNYSTFELSTQYLIGGRLREAIDKPVVQDGINSVTYIKIKTLQYLALTLRASYGFHRHNISNMKMVGYEINYNYQAYKLDNPSVIIEDIGGTTMYYMQYVSLGVGVYQKQDLKFSTQNYGTKDYSMMTTYYFDVLLPVSQELSNMDVTDRTKGNPINYEVNVNDHTLMTKYGFRAGMKFQSVSRNRRINSGAKIELGFLPGPNKLTDNFFISIGLDLNMSFNTQK